MYGVLCNNTRVLQIVTHNVIVDAHLQGTRTPVYLILPFRSTIKNIFPRIRLSIESKCTVIGRFLLMLILLKRFSLN